MIRVVVRPLNLWVILGEAITAIGNALLLESDSDGTSGLLLELDTDGTSFLLLEG